MFGDRSYLRSTWRTPLLPAKRILVINGHTDPMRERYCADLCAAYTQGAQSGGHKTQHIDIAALPAPGAANGHQSWLRNEAAEVLEYLWSTDRIFIAFPMLAEGPPTALKLILEEFQRWQDRETEQIGERPRPKETDIVVTANFPSLVYRNSQGVPAGAWWMVLSGLDVVRNILIGSMESISPKDRDRWLLEVSRRGASSCPYVPERVDRQCSN